MKLYFAKGACSLACRIVINEINMSCDYIAVNLKTKKTEEDENFLHINPKGSVPVLITDDNTILTENAVIQQYLADINHATTLLPDIRALERYRVLEWLNYVATELHKGFGIFFNPHISDEIKKTVFTPIIKHKFSYVNESLENKTFLMGDQFTLPDAYLFVILTWALNFGFDLSEWPQLLNYFSSLKKRPSISKSLQQEDLQFDNE